MASIIHSFLFVTLFAFYQRINTSKVSLIRYGINSGFCSGYCSKVISIDEKKIVTTEIWQSGKANLSIKPNKIDTVFIGKTRWTQLINQLNIEAFSKLPNEIGCPGCDDGAEEWIEIKINGKIRKVTFEYGMQIEGMMPLLNNLRKKE